MSHLPAILAFAEPNENGSESDSIYKYLSDAGFDENEVKSWGNIGSLMEAMKDADKTEAEPLDNDFIEFVKKLPAGTTPKPMVKKQLQHVIPV